MRGSCAASSGHEQSAARDAEGRTVLLRRRAGGVGAQTRSAGARDRVEPGDGAADRGRQHHQLRRRRLRPGLGARRHRGARPRADAERAPDLRQPGSRRLAEDAGGAPGAGDVQRVRAHRRLAEGQRDAAVVRPGCGAVDRDDRRAARPARRAVPHCGRRLAVQVRARGLPLSVPQAGEEDCGRGGPGDHPGRLGCPQVPRAEALPGRARAADADPRQRLRPEPARRGNDGQGAPARLLGVAGAGRADSPGVDGAGRRAQRPAGAGGADGGGAEGPRLRRGVSGRDARRPADHPDHPPRRGAGAGVGSAGRSAAIRQPGRVLPGHGAAAAPAAADRSRGAGCDGPHAAGAVGEKAEGHLDAAADSGVLRVGRSPRAGRPGRAGRVHREAAGVRLRGMRQLRPGPHGIRLPADLPETDAEWALRRHVPGTVRGRGQAVHLGEGDGTGRGHQQPRRTQDLHSAARSPAQRHQLLDQLLPRTRQPAGRVVLGLGSVAAGHAGAPGHASYVVSAFRRTCDGPAEAALRSAGSVVRDRLRLALANFTCGRPWHTMLPLVGLGTDLPQETEAMTGAAGSMPGKSDQDSTSQPPRRRAAIPLRSGFTTTGRSIWRS